MEGLFYAVAALLAASGTAKLIDQAGTSGALAAAGLPSGRTAVRSLALTEIAVSVTGLAVAGVVGGLAVAVVYLGFAAFVSVALRQRLPLQSCGCFGREDTPPHVIHLVVDVAAAASGLWVAATGAPSLPAVLADQPMWGLPYVGLLGVGVYAVYLLLSELPRLARQAAAPR